MRMWLCDPKILCQKHLCGMHVELHMFVGSMKRKIKMDGFIKNNLLEPLKLKECHEDISSEMMNRGYNHKSPLLDNDIRKALENLSIDQLNYRIDKNNSLNELLSRCPLCKKRYETM